MTCTDTTTVSVPLFFRGRGPKILLSLAIRNLLFGKENTNDDRNDGKQFLLHVGLGGLEPPTSSLSGKRSNQAELKALTMPRKITPAGAPTPNSRVIPLRSVERLQQRFHQNP